MALGILGSLLFYAWGNLVFLPLILGLTLATYGLAHGIDRWRGHGTGRLLMWMGVITVIGILLYYRLREDLPYPLGLSFLALQVIAYLAEVHSRRIEAEKDLLTFSLYLLLFPKILVGPITRYSQVQQELATLQTNPGEIADGFRRFVRGLAKKVLIADTLARTVTPVFALTSPVITPSMAWLVVLAYCLQLYFDFSGYTDMAIGLGRMLGVKLPENFNLPYLAGSIGEFWRRWHISLSAWFRDFVFFPLERRRLRWIGQPLNILVVFALTGLWHGLTVNFLLWGLLHACALIFESTALGRKITSTRFPVRNGYALLVILAGWVIFRSPTPDFAFDFLRRLAGDTSGLQILPFHLTSPLPFIEPTFVLALVSGILFSLPLRQWYEACMGPSADGAPAVTLPARIAQDVLLMCLLLLSLSAAAASVFSPGIYEQF